jgi:hypothetical protein
MWSRIRTVTMWLLMAALPVQSWAAAAMVNCGPTHHRMGAQAAVEVAPGHSDTTHGQEAPSHSGHHHAYPHHEMAADGHADQDPSDSQSLSMGKFKCSACGTCCLGTVLPSPVLTFDASVCSATVESGMPQGHVVFLTAGLERPPRNILA